MSRQCRVILFIADNTVALATATFRENLRSQADRLNPIRHEALNDSKLPTRDIQAFPKPFRYSLGLTVLPPLQPLFFLLQVGRSQARLCNVIEGAPSRTPNFRGRQRALCMTVVI